MKNKVKSKIVLIAAACSFMSLALANVAPVVDVTSQDQQAQPSKLPQGPLTVQPEQLKAQAQQPAQTQGAAPQAQPVLQPPMTTSQRLTRLEQQMQNLTRMNLPQQIANIQQQLQQLQGQLQVQSHDLTLLNKQQKSFYRDLDQRISQLQNLSSNDGSTAAPAPSAPAVNNNIQAKDANAYRSAFNLLVQKKYDQAKQAFLNYLNEFPNGKFLVNSHYWLGEIYLLQKATANAQTQFQAVIKKFPKSAKVPDAKLKLAQISIQQGNVAKAKQQLLEIIKKYRGKTAAQLATLQLKELNNKK